MPAVAVAKAGKLAAVGKWSPYHERDMTILFKLLRRQAGRQLDPLHVSMTGVKMGERVLVIGCDDRALLAGLASKTGLSGFAAVAAFDDEAADRARGVGAKIGALIEVQTTDGSSLPFDEGSFDMVVVDDTRGSFASRSAGVRTSMLNESRRMLRSGGRIEVVEGVGGGWLGGVVRPARYDVAQELEAAGFKPVRGLAARDGFRFVEGLKSFLPVQ